MLICPFFSNMEPSAKDSGTVIVRAAVCCATSPSTGALPIRVRFLTGISESVLNNSEGIPPTQPNPPHSITAPSVTSAKASRLLAYILFNGYLSP